MKNPSTYYLKMNKQTVQLNTRLLNAILTWSKTNPKPKLLHYVMKDAARGRHRLLASAYQSMTQKGARPKYSYTICYARWRYRPGARRPNSSVNTLLGSYGEIQSNVLCKLFQAYCCSFYGSELWVCNSNGFNRYITEWNKALRRSMRIPHRSHRWLLGQ